MQLFLIRHGETVDNIAGLYAGVRDSKLTNHGVEQARCMGDYFSKNDVKLTHLFSSPLSRALKTAEAIQQKQPAGQHASSLGRLEITQVHDLIEQDFGYYEGKSFHARADPKKSGRDAHAESHKGEPGFVDVENRELMARRADAFLDQHLLPLFDGDEQDEESVIAIVSHGMLLLHLWRRLLLRLPRQSLTMAPEVMAARGNLVLEHLGGWSNTGYLELSIRRDNEPETQPALDAGEVAADVATLPTPVPPPLGTDGAAVSISATTSAQEGRYPTKAPPRTLSGWSTTILAIDSKQHLIGLKRQRGGIGSLAHDEGQKKLDGFFKRQKLS